MAELDHVLICVNVDAPEIEALLALGLSEGSRNHHPGQGTANRRIFFHNLMLELLWVEDPVAAQSPGIARTGLWKRWHRRREGACPLGFGFRPPPEDGLRAEGISPWPFAAWDYRPPYLPPSVSIAMAITSDDPHQPLMFGIPFGQRPDRFPPERAQPLHHANGWHQITRITYLHPPESLSPSCPGLLTRPSLGHGVELGIDQEAQGQRLDLSPTLPLRLCW
ncbi:MAG: VOC family protein [Synechococcales cyanobacterium]